MINDLNDMIYATDQRTLIYFSVAQPLAKRNRPERALIKQTNMREMIGE